MTSLAVADILLCCAAVAVGWYGTSAGLWYLNRSPAVGYDPSPSELEDDDLGRLWRRHLDALAGLEAQYVEFETDPWSTFRRPLLADVREPETAAFHQALRRAQDLRADTDPASRFQVAEFGDAVHVARMAWAVADQHARDIAVPTVSDSERRRIGP